MIRSARIPDILSRIITPKDPVIQAVLLVTADGELLGSTGSVSSPSSSLVSSPSSPGDNSPLNMDHLGALIADIAVDYQQLGDVLNQSNQSNSSSTSSAKSKKSTTLLLELEQGLVGVSSCMDCWIIAIAATPNAPLGMIQARLQAITEYVQEGLSPLTETAMDR